MGKAFHNNGGRLAYPSLVSLPKAVVLLSILVCQGAIASHIRIRASESTLLHFREPCLPSYHSPIHHRMCSRSGRPHVQAEALHARSGRCCLRGLESRCFRIVRLPSGAVSRNYFDGLRQSNDLEVLQLTGSGTKKRPLGARHRCPFHASCRHASHPHTPRHRHIGTCSSSNESHLLSST